MRPIVLRALLLAALLLPNGAAAQFSSVSASRVSDCCYSFTVGNTSGSTAWITEFTMKITAPGATALQTAQAPPGWTVSYPDPTAVRFIGVNDSIGFAQSRVGFSVCFQVPGNVFALDWITASYEGPVDLGAFQLACTDQCDSLAVRMTPGSCCAQATVWNRNPGRVPVTRVAFRMVTPGSRFGGALQLPAGWTVLAQTDSLITAGTSGSGIAFNDSLSGFGFCLEPAIGGPPSSLVQWATLRDSTALCNGTLTLQCAAGSTCDEVTLTAQGSCCFSLRLRNANSALAPINGLDLALELPGATFTGTPAGPWRARIITPTLIRFSTPGSGLSGGQEVSGLTFCVDPPPGYSGPVRLRWTTRSGGTGICEQTVTVTCTSVAPACDTVTAAPASPAPPGGCAWTVALANTHTPPGPIDGLRLRVIDPGVSFSGTPSGPWTVSTSTATEILFTTTSPLASGGRRSGFLVAVTSPAPGTVRLVWETRNGASVVCTDTLRLACTPAPEPEDEFRLRDLGACRYDAGFTNRRSTAAVTTFTARIVGPQGSIATATPPAGWQLASQTAQSVRFTTAPGTPPGSARDGFLLTFVPPGSGAAFAVQLCTSLDGAAVVCDTVQVRCTVETRCDSLMLRSDPSACSVELGLVNTHLPASPFNGLRVTVSTPGATLLSATAPTGWVIDNRTATLVDFRDTSGSIPTNGSVEGFLLTFRRAAGSPDVAFQWCSVLNGQIVCCGTSSLRCAVVYDRCDSLLVAPEAGACAFDFGFTNTHNPSSPVTVYRIAVRTPGASLLGADAPAGWTRTAFDTSGAEFRAIGTGVDPGLAQRGFRIAVRPSPVSSTISLGWCTEGATGPICCDSTIVECQPAPERCDTVAVRADTTLPCCYDLTVFNVHQPPGNVTDVRLQVLTPGVEVFTLFPGAPVGWTKEVTPVSVTWKTTAAVLAPAQSLAGFSFCLDNSGGSGVNDVLLRWETRVGEQPLCADTLTVHCSSTTDAADAPTSPRRFALHQNHPNPFHPVTVLPYDIPRAAHVRLVVHDVTGRIVRTLVDGPRQPGSYVARFDARGLPAGTYLARLSSDGLTAVRVLVVSR